MSIKIVPSLPDPGENRPGLRLRISRETSVEAAELITPNTGTLKRLVLEVIAHSPGGLTDHEISVLTGLSYNTSGPRRRELMRLGWVRDSGKKRLNEETGCHQEVWVLTSQARVHLTLLGR